MTCGEFYADDSLAFCLADGAPLVRVEAGSEIWTEGARVVSRREQALRQRTRRLKRWRVVTTVTTMLVTTMVVCVVAVNSYIYLAPRPPEVAQGAPAKEPTPRANVLATPTPDASPDATPDATPTPSDPAGDSDATPTPTPTPDRGRDTDATDPHTPTRDERPPEPPAGDPQGPPPTVETDTTPTGTGIVPLAIMATPATPTPTPVPDRPTPTPTPFPDPVRPVDVAPPPRPAVCTGADQQRESQLVVATYGGAWRRKIEGERARIVGEYAAAGQRNVEAALGEVQLSGGVLPGCAGGVFTARYVWQVRAGGDGPAVPPRVFNVPRTRRFTCFKLGGAWLCR